MTEVNKFADISCLRNANETQIVYPKLTVAVSKMPRLSDP